MEKYKFRLRLLPVIVYTAVVVLLVKAHSYQIDIGDNPDLPINSSNELWDVFCHVKSSAILFVAIWAALTMAYLLIIGQMKIKKTFIYIPMAIYTATVVISYYMSDYKWMAWNGGVSRFEGTRTILCYMFMLFYTINVVDEMRDAVLIGAASAAGVFIACIIGITQLLGFDFLLSGIGGRMITGGGDIALQGEFLPGQVYQTVANMNYVGMYLSLIVPVLIFAIYFFGIKKNGQELANYGIDYRNSRDKRKCLAIVIAAGILLLLIALNIYGAASLGGALGIAVSIVVLLIVFSRRKWQKAVIAIAAVVVTAGFLVTTYNAETDTHKQIDYIETGTDYVDISVDGRVIGIRYHRDNDDLEIRSYDGSTLGVASLDGEDGIYQVFEDSRYNSIMTVAPLKDINGEQCIAVVIEDEGFAFTYYEDGAKYLNPFGREISLGHVDSMGFEGHLTSGSGRGYIWSRTLPLLKDRLLTGSGADTFLLVFPLDDYAGKFSAGAPLQTICDKPHNMYLNMIVGTGAISLIAFITIVVMAMWSVFRLDEDKIFIKIIASGIIGFLFSGMFNDSSVCIMPMFYGLLGTVIANGIATGGN